MAYDSDKAQMLRELQSLTAERDTLKALCGDLTAKLAVLKTEGMVCKFEDGSIDIFWQKDGLTALLNIPSSGDAPTAFGFKYRSPAPGASSREG